MKLLIDFSGYKFTPKFIITECSFCEIDVTPDIILTITTNTSRYLSPQRTNTIRFQNFIEKYGLKNDFTQSKSLKQLQNNLIEYIKSSTVIYLKNKSQLGQLMNFYSTLWLYRHKFKFLTDLGFDESNEVMEVTDCFNHFNRYSYCTQANCQLMANWMINRKLEKLNNCRNMELVISFSGYEDVIQKFRFKEFSINGINQRIVYKKLYIVNPPIYSNPVSASLNKVRYDLNYYEYFGINYYDGNIEEDKLLKKLEKIIKKYDINTVYVSNHYQRSIFSQLVPSMQVVALEDYGYVEEIEDNVCEYHTDGDEQNLCADAKGRSMANWIINRDINENDYLDDKTIEMFVDDLDELPVIDTEDLEWI